MEKFNPVFLLTVPRELYDATCAAVSQTFAESYLFGAELHGDRLTPRTLTGYTQMLDRTDFVRLLKSLTITLVKPTPWPGDGNRMSAGDAMRRPR